MKSTHQNKMFQIPFSFLCIIVFYSCSSSSQLSKDYLYFQSNLDSIATQMKEPVIKPNDLLSINIYSKSLNQVQTAVFNLPNTSSEGSNSGGGMVQGYHVDVAGNIDFPIIGTVQASGLTKVELQSILSQKLAIYIKDPSVIVRLINFRINVLGEVKTPGVHSFNIDRVTLLDAISAAGDLTDFANRDNIMVIREENGRRNFYKMDIRSGAFFKSPAFQLYPNDVVYISANTRKLKTLNVDAEAQRKTGFVFNTIAFVGSIVTLIVSLSK
jgi:polysaccharide biosynthesis/export protein